MTSFEFEAPEEFGGGGNFLETPGTYHMLVNDVKETDKDGKLLDGFRVTFEVVDGTVRDSSGCTETGKTCSLTFFKGKMSSKDGGRFARQKQAAFFVAAGVIGLREVEAIKSKSLRSVDLDRAKNAQVVMTLERNEFEKDGKKSSRLDIHYSSVFHVDDLAAANFPKSARHLALLPKDRRLTPQQIQEIKDAFSGGSGGGTASSSRSSASGGGAATVANDVTAGL